MHMGLMRVAYNRQGGPSGDAAVESSNWAMGMGQSRLVGGTVSVMGMLSLEPATIRGRGSPQLLQTGETYRGEPLVDHQHPHDFVMNLSATWSRPIGEHSAAWVQAAPRGEPALGPTAFMHRASAGDNPAPPLGHHWQDSTHITANVVTLGGSWTRFALEGSVFHGREPDERRWNLDFGALDSVAVRLQARIAAAWSAQASWGHINEPEALVRGDQWRTTASVHYGADGDRPVGASLIWGRNRELGHPTSQSVSLEGAWQATARDQVFLRSEWVQKDATLLVAKGFPPGGGDAGFDDVAAFTGGYSRGLVETRGVEVAVGADVTAYALAARVRPYYGSPVSVHVFARGRWGRHQHHGAGGHAR